MVKGFSSQGQVREVSTVTFYHASIRMNEKRWHQRQIDRFYEWAQPALKRLAVVTYILFTVAMLETISHPSCETLQVSMQGVPELARPEQ